MMEQGGSQKMDAAPETESRRIWVVDDDPLFRQAAEAQLRYYHFEVRSLADAAELRQALGGARPDALIMDMRFVGESEAVLGVQEESGAPLPTVFVSSTDDIGTRLAAVRAGGADFFPKPVDFGALADRLDHLLQAGQEEPMRILVVDDSPSVARLHAAILQEAGMLASIVTDPLQVMEPLRELAPDLILMDMYMPGCQGDELAAVIRQQEEFVGIPIVYLSSEQERSNQLRAMGQGGDDFLSKPIQPDHLVEAVQTRVRRARVLRGFMSRDSLTGLLNHVHISEALETELARARRQQGRLAVAMVDIDLFKKVNDTHGHPAGDRVLKSLARLFQRRLRASDLIGRYGGEEFMVVLADVDAGGARAILDGLREDFAALRHHAAGGEFSVTFSAGVAAYPGFKEAGALVDAADAALYQAKRGGRNRVVPAGSE